MVRTQTKVKIEGNCVEHSLGDRPSIENLLRKSPFRPDFSIIFVKQARHSPQMIEKFDSKILLRDNGYLLNNIAKCRS